MAIVAKDFKAKLKNHDGKGVQAMLQAHQNDPKVTSLLYAEVQEYYSVASRGTLPLFEVLHPYALSLFKATGKTFDVFHEEIFKPLVKAKDPILFIILYS